MNNLVKWNPFHEVRSLRDRMNSLFDSSFLTRDDEVSFLPAVNVSETEREYKITAELPGLKKDEVSVSFQNGVLTLSGERKQQHEEKNARYHVFESSYGRFSRSFTLPGDTDPEKIDAEFKDGVLTLGIAKSESAKTKEISIK